MSHQTIFGGLSLSSINKNQRSCAIKHQGFMPNSDVDPLESFISRIHQVQEQEIKDQQYVSEWPASMV